MLSEREVSAAIGRTAYGPNGEKIGTVEHFFVDDRTGAPTWVALQTGLFGTRTSIAPAVEATVAGDAVRLPVTAEAVKSAPHLAGDHLDPGEETALRRHYGLDLPPTGAAWAPTTEGIAPPGAGGRPERAAPPGSPAGSPAGPPAGPPTTGAAPPAPDDGSMTRSEERLAVATERVPATRVRVVKYVVTEEVQVTVPLRREEIRIEEVPLGTADEPGDVLVADAPGPTGGLPEEIVLHAERPVVGVEVVPTERVRLRVEVVAGQETVSGQVQREQIVVDQDRRTGPEPDLDRRTGP